MIKRPSKATNPYISLYSVDYFRENSIEKPKDRIFWDFEYLTYSQGVEDFLEDLGHSEEYREKAFHNFVRAKLPDLYKAMGGDCPYGASTIWGIQFHNEGKALEMKIGQELYNQAIAVLDSSSGDDSYYDYDPGFAYFIMMYLKQLQGCQPLVKKLQKVLDDRDD